MEIRRDHLEPEFFYHIYNRGINSEAVYKNKDNYLYFLKKAKEFLLPVADIYAYCLMKNHFHLLVRIKPEVELKTFFDSQNKNTKIRAEGIHALHSIVSKQFAKLMSSYTQGFNKYYNRHGSLFETPVKRIRITDEVYLRNCIIYIHQNSLDINEQLEKYDFSSYKIILSNSKTELKREEVISYFEDIDNFKFCHQRIVEI